MASRHWFHKFGPWSEVQREVAQFTVGSSYQTRECKTCGYVQRRWL